MLLTRLVLVTIAISIFVAALVVISERNRVIRVIEDRTLIRIGSLRMLVLKQLDSPGLGDHAAIKAMLKAVAYKGAYRGIDLYTGHYDLSTGHYVFLRILDPSFSEVARIEDPEHENIAALVKHVESEGSHPTPKQKGITRTRVLDKKYIHTLLPLINSQGVVAAYVEGFFTTSREEEQHELLALLRAICLAVGIVIATSLLLYPVILRLMRRLERLSQTLLESNLETLGMLGSAIAKRDSDTDIHNFRVTIYSVRMAESLGLDNETIRVLIRGAFLHDVGKIGVRDNILLKPGRLDVEEFAEMKKHVNYGIDIVTRSSWLRPSLSVVGSHHEKLDGNGYPSGLKGGDIHILAKIFAIADVFDALTSQRPYKEPIGFDESIEILMQGRGTHFDPEILDAFVKIARPLFDLYGNKDDDRPRKDLAEIQDRYYKVNIATFLD